MATQTVELQASYQHLKFERQGDVAVVTLNRPNRRNALSLDLMTELINCFSAIGRDREIHAVILAAAGNVFCAGHDLAEMVGKNINDYRHIFDTCTDLMTKIQSIPQPVIAEVQGTATAAGCQLVEFVRPERLRPDGGVADGHRHGHQHQRDAGDLDD